MTCPSGSVICVNSPSELYANCVTLAAVPPSGAGVVTDEQVSVRIVRVCGDVPKWVGDRQRLAEGVVCVRSRGVTRICLLGDAQQILIGIVTIGSSVTELVESSE